MGLTSKLECKQWTIIFTPHLTETEWDLLRDWGFWDEICTKDLQSGKWGYSMEEAVNLLGRYFGERGFVVVEAWEHG